MVRQLEPLPQEEQRQLQLLRNCIKTFKNVCIAYSGGVDSALVAAISQEQLGDHALAVTGVSEALTPQLREEASQQALWLGIRHKECLTKELEDPQYQTNPQNRCFACKRELHRQLSAIAKEANGAQVIDGVNHDDIKDHRPGIEAAREAGVRSPLVELKIGKDSVRRISKALGLPWWDKPAQPCLASRFPYGQAINAEGLAQVNMAEEWLKSNGFSEVRVRSQNLAAKIEVPIDQIDSLIINLGKEKIVEYFLAIGFTSVSVDLEGLVSGKLNRQLLINR